MRDKLCEMIREYLTEGNGEKSVLFSTHNISDMENVTDYAIIVEHGNIVEEGFVEDLKEKYILVKGEAKDAAAAEKILYSFSGNTYGFEGICLAEVILDFMVFGGICAKEVSHLDYLKGSRKGERIIQYALTGSMVRMSVRS